MNYANNTGTKCFRCNTSIDTHAIPFIRSDDATEKLAKALQSKLDSIYLTALKKGYTLPTEAVMAGAIIATIGSTVVKAVSLSGDGANDILMQIQAGLGADVVILSNSLINNTTRPVSNNVDLKDYKTLLGISLRDKVTSIDKSRATAATPTPTPTGGMLSVIPLPNYPVGACAAQKLLYYVISQALAKKQHIKQLNMAEIFWKSGGKFKWSTGDVVPSCNTCNWVLPMMLCNYNDMQEKVPYS